MFSINPIQINLRHSSSKLLFIALAMAGNMDLTATAASIKHGEAVHSFNQTKIKVKGKVVDNQTKEPLASVSILVGGVPKGTTDRTGHFEIEVEAGASIRFQLIGYESHTKSFATAQTDAQIALNVTSEALNEVVVTALGIQREEKALGYSISTVKGEELTNAISNNWTDALTGKVAGLNLVKSGAGPLGSNKVILRGETSLTGQNDALIVVDGIIMGGGVTMTGTGNSNYLDADSPVDFGSSLADINPEDIESVSVLKGPGAAALYGYRGAHGAVIITTKKGKGIQNRIGVTVNSNTAIGTINRWPDYQYEYGQGVVGQDLYYSYGQSEDGASTLSTSSAWGPKFDGQYFYQYDPANYRLTPAERTLWRPYENNRKDLFQTELTSTNSISVSGSTEKTTARFSYTNVRNKWIIPNMGYNRHTIAMQFSNKITDKLSLSTKINFNNRGSDNLPNSGYNNQSYMYFVRGITPNIDAAWLDQNWIPGKEGIEQMTPFSGLLDNPRTISYDMVNAQNKNNLIGNVQLDYKFTNELSLMLRTGIDMGYDKRKQSRPFDTNKYAFGYYREQSIYAEERNSDFLMQYNNQRLQDHRFGISAGGALINRKYIKDDAKANSLLYPNQYNFANARERVLYDPYREEYAIHSVYGLANYSYKEKYFIDFTGRVDWASTLASPKRNEVAWFFYPSVNTSFILSQIFELPKSINYWKLRASIAGVGGGGTEPYGNSYAYQSAIGFNGGLTNPTTVPDENLQPERTTSYELGTDFRMFKDRIKLDLTVYSTTTDKQLIKPPVDPSSGYRLRYTNAGEVRSKGIEIALSGDILKSQDKLNWNMYGNFTHYDSKVLSIPAAFEGQLVLSTLFGSRGSVVAIPDRRFGDIWGLGYERNSEGKIVYEGGVPVLTQDNIYIGNPNPTTKFGWGNEFKYKGFRFNFLFDGQFGGVGYSLTHAVLMEEGKLKKTLPGRYNGIIGDGVVRNPDGSYSKNTVVAEAGDYYARHFNRDNIESNTFSTDFIKLREVRLDYALPKSFLSRYKIEKASIGVYGRDLFVFTKWPAFDPEFASLTSSGIEKGAEIAQFPSTRTMGVNLSFSF
ncbi:SusC/RagA family TonB-linked outer membrane protein [Sphingobacterium athyrii]|uniref:SusC/RagA family TonB-linked outer membrane protein n=1 Tax=Sphingobacterium athyrii TaxID=2152717 RepID=A0A363NRD0_9SPHI|nr:SusC/RagA family TonB-linked outer membrane protein [Sphingobacterium athyrii]PUV23313.1 SusC/RagA family TonB-linked outer membrane protein [Sphingobacterium athyrii]